MAKAKPQPPDPADELTAARARVGAGDVETALAHLATAWMRVPSPRIAALAATLAKRVKSRPLPAKIAERDAAWLALAATCDPRALPTLLAADWPVHPRAAKARLTALLEFPADPQIAEALVGLCLAKRYLSNAGDVFWRRAWTKLDAWGEPRASDLARGAKPTAARPRITPPVERALAALEATVAASDGARTSATSRDALFAAVHDDPAADGPRSVLADALLADEDPRGELIQLQLAGKGGKAVARARALIRAHGATWLDGLGERVVGPVFRRGFVADVTVVGAPRDLELRAWSTIETLRFLDPPKQGELAKALAHPNLAGVRAVFGVPADGLAGVSRTLDQLHVVAPVGTLPKQLRVRELSIGGSHPIYNDGVARPLAELLAWFDTTGSRVGATALVIDRTEEDLPAAYHWFQTRELASLVLSPAFGIGQIMAWELALTRDVHGRTVLDATWHGRLYDQRGPRGIGAAVAQLPPNALAACSARAVVALEPDVRDLLARQLATGLAGRTLTPPVLFP